MAWGSGHGLSAVSAIRDTLSVGHEVLDEDEYRTLEQDMQRMLKTFVVHCPCPEAQSR